MRVVSFRALCEVQSCLPSGLLEDAARKWEPPEGPSGIPHTTGCKRSSPLVIGITCEFQALCSLNYMLSVLKTG